MIEQGLVTEVKDGLATVRITPADKKSCGSCAMCKHSSGQDMLIKVKVDDYISAGDRVKIQVEEKNKAVLSLIVFGVPLLMLGLGAWAGSKAAAGEIGVVIGGFAGVIVSVVLLKVIDSAFGEKFRPAAKVLGKWVGENDRNNCPHEKGTAG